MVRPVGFAPPMCALELCLERPPGSNIHVLQLPEDPGLGLTQALKPSAAAGRTPLPLSVCPGKQATTDTSVPVIGALAAVQDQLASEWPSPLHFRLHVYGRSTRAAVAASGRADGAVRALRSEQPTRTTTPTSSPVIPIALMLRLQSVRSPTVGPSYSSGWERGLGLPRPLPRAMLDRRRRDAVKQTSNGSAWSS